MFGLEQEEIKSKALAEHVHFYSSSKAAKHGAAPIGRYLTKRNAKSNYVSRALHSSRCMTSYSLWVTLVRLTVLSSCSHLRRPIQGDEGTSMD